MFFVKALFCLSLLFLVNSEVVRSPKTWYFFGNQNVSASGDEALPQIACLGPLCTEVQIHTVKCELFSPEEFKCHSPDVSSEDGLRGNYKLYCIDNKFDQESCYIEVIVERQFSVSPVTQLPPVNRANGINFVNLVIAFVLSQIVLSCCMMPILYFYLRPVVKG